MIIYTYPTSIAEAVEILDEAYPNWRSRIDCNKLNMSSQYDCVLGQAFNGYSQGMMTLFELDPFVSGRVGTSLLVDRIFGANAPVDEWREHIEDNPKGLGDVVNRLKKLSDALVNMAYNTRDNADMTGDFYIVARDLKDHMERLKKWQASSNDSTSSD